MPSKSVKTKTAPQPPLLVDKQDIQSTVTVMPIQEKTTSCVQRFGKTTY